jgi:hypothetical protein
MNAGTKLAALNKFRSPASGINRQASAKVLVVYDVVVKAPDVQQVPLVINYGTYPLYLQIPLSFCSFFDCQICRKRWKNTPTGEFGFFSLDGVILTHANWCIVEWRPLWLPIIHAPEWSLISLPPLAET